MIAIPNMEKPKDCKECQWHLDFYIEDEQVGGLCTITEKDDRENTCPLIEIDDEAIDIAQDIIDGCKELKERVNKDIVTCRECKYFNLNEWDETISGVPIIVAHEICHKWGDGCKTDSNGFCFMGERRTDEE